MDKESSKWCILISKRIYFDKDDVSDSTSESLSFSSTASFLFTFVLAPKEHKVKCDWEYIYGKESEILKIDDPGDPTWKMVFKHDFMAIGNCIVCTGKEEICRLFSYINIRGICLPKKAPKEGRIQDYQGVDFGAPQINFHKNAPFEHLIGSYKTCSSNLQIVIICGNVRLELSPCRIY